MSVSVVPWYNSEEWRDVFYNIYGTESAKKHKALWQLRGWKARCPDLPGGVECTLGFLHVLCKHEESTDESTDVLRYAYCTAVMRFVNIMLDQEYVRTRSMFFAAKNRGIPQWIVNMRHDVSHNHSLPPLEMLEKAASFGMEWLKENYWLKQECTIRDYISGYHYTEAQYDHIKSLISIYISVCTFRRLCKAKTFGDLQPKETRMMFLTEIKEFLGDDINIHRPGILKIKDVVKMLEGALKKDFNKTNNFELIVARAFVDQDSLLLSEEFLEMFNITDDELSRQYVNCFKGILTLLHKKDALLNVVTMLLNLVNDDMQKDGRRRLSALWLQQILHALHKSNLYTAKFIISKGRHIQMNKNTEMSFAHWFPNESHGLYLDLTKQPPRPLTDMQYIKPFIVTYNPYLKYFIQDMLKLIHPQMTTSNVEFVIKLCQIFTTDSVDNSYDTVYTVKDLKKLFAPNGKNGEEMEVAEDSDYEQDVIRESIWKLASTDVAWDKLPIGHAFGNDRLDMGQQDENTQLNVEQSEIVDVSDEGVDLQNGHNDEVELVIMEVEHNGNSLNEGILLENEPQEEWMM